MARAHLSSTEAARLLGVSSQTLRSWADRGKVRCFRTVGGHRRFDPLDIAALARGEHPPAAGLPRHHRYEAWRAAALSVLRSAERDLDDLEALAEPFRRATAKLEEAVLLEPALDETAG